MAEPLYVSPETAREMLDAMRHAVRHTAPGTVAPLYLADVIAKAEAEDSLTRLNESLSCRVCGLDFDTHNDAGLGHAFESKDG
jgi:hypothetical protein